MLLILWIGLLCAISSVFAGPIARNPIGGIVSVNGRCEQPCDRASCPKVMSCIGNSSPIQDACNCCLICPSTEQQIDHACEGISCPKRKVCMLNIQGLPTCRCPSIFSCPKGAAIARGKKAVCGMDGITYKTACHLAVSECVHNKKIRIDTPGQCPVADVAVSKKQSQRMPVKRKRGKGRKKEYKKNHHRADKPSKANRAKSQHRKNHGAQHHKKNSKNKSTNKKQQNLFRRQKRMKRKRKRRMRRRLSRERLLNRNISKSSDI
ncbi:uncharacterized protein LOC141910341 [Tubulanus polymorphus]|uniref:uncharacterized protein LOC141910341 n=1 Tax=Tubulanus polymorphus TaxID=672921 RepID=UPI003DA4CF4D